MEPYVQIREYSMVNGISTHENGGLNLERKIGNCRMLYNAILYYAMLFL